MTPLNFKTYMATKTFPHILDRLHASSILSMSVSID